MSELRKLERAEEKARTAREKHAAYEDLAEYYLNQQAFETALDYYEKELQAATELKDAYKIAKAHRMIGEAKCELSLFEEALKAQKKYFEYASQGGKERLVEQQRALTTLGRTHFLNGESLRDRDSPSCQLAYSQARGLFMKSLLICEKLTEAPKSEVADMRARSLLNLGLVLEAQGELKEAIENMTMAVRVCRKYILPSTLRLCCLSLACCLVRQNDIPQALKLFKEATASARPLPEPEKTHALCEVMLAQSEAYLRLGDVRSARKVLQKAYSLKTPVVGERKAIERKLRTVAAMDLALTRLLHSSELSHDKLARLYEKLGDGFSLKGVYSHALTYYKKMLESSKLADLNLRPCYVSLAQTSKDLKQYSDAIKYFEQEIACSSPSEACLSLLAIVQCQEKLDASLSECEETYNRALNMAERAGNIKLQLRVLRELESTQRTASSPLADATKRKRISIQENHNINESSDVDDDDDVEAETPDMGDDIDLDALSDCTDGEEEEFDRSSTAGQRPKRNPQRQRETVKWKNEKGETKLHLACINGKSGAVRTLLEQGCDVNAMDNAGWTPLHEACNNGHGEIVELLLDHGANINHKGGQHAGGITPLHDAASAGNFEIMNILLDRNASATILTDEGDSPLDTLIQFHERGGHELTPEELQEYQHMVDRLNSCLDKVGHPRKDDMASSKSRSYLDSSHRNSRGIAPKTRDKDISPKLGAVVNLRKSVDNSDLDDNFSRRRNMREISPLHSDPGSSPVRKSNSDKDEDEDEGVLEYQSVMLGLRNSTTAEKLCSTTRKPLQPLVFENEVVEDWLEDDVGPRPSKKRKTNEFKAQSNSYKPLSLKKTTSRVSLASNSTACSTSDRRSTGSHDSHEGSRLSTGSGVLDMPNDTIEDFDMDQPWGDDAMDFRPDTPSAFSERSLDMGSSRPNRFRRQSTMLSFGVTRETSIIEPQADVTIPPGFQPPPSQNPVLQPPIQNRLNVRIENRLLALPIPNPTLSIGWLAAEAAKRFYKIEGSLPILGLQTKDGALLADDDPVSLLFGGDEVVGCVQSWNVPPITERYSEACEALSQESDGSILLQLEACQATQALEIANLVLPAPILKPVFRAIAMQHSLLKLNFANNYMRDEGLMELCTYLGRLVNLRELDICGNGITAQGLAHLSNCASNGKIQTLYDLNLSHNDLRDSSLQHLVTLTASLPSLSCLALADCGFTKAIWDTHDCHLTLSGLIMLDLSANQLHEKGLSKFLGFSDFEEKRRLNPERMKRLHLVGVGGSLLCQELVLFLERGRIIGLQELHLSYPSMQDEDLSHLIRVLESAPDFHTLRIIAPKVSGQSVIRLLKRLHLQHLQVLGNSDMWKKVSTRELQEAILSAENTLKSLTLKNVPEVLLGFKNVVKRGACGLVLTKNEMQT